MFVSIAASAPDKWERKRKRCKCTICRPEARRRNDERRARALVRAMKGA